MTTIEIEAEPGEDARQIRLHAIQLATLRPLAALAFDLFVQRDRQSNPILYRQRNLPLTQEDINRLVEAQTEHLYITDLGCLRYEQYLGDNLDYFIENEATPLKIRFKFLHDAAAALLRPALQVIRLEPTLRAASRLARQIVPLVQGRSMTPSRLHDLLRRDARLVTHLVNVACYGVLLAERCGVRDERRLEEVALGGLLHDVGLRDLAGPIPDRADMSDVELDLWRRHPQSGYELLHRQKELSNGQLMMVYQHHERMDGSGFPVRVPGEEMHWLARVCAVVETFDAHTSPQGARKGLVLCDAMDYLRREAGALFDKELAQCWTS